jgi:hypothetical protein
MQRARAPIIRRTIMSAPLNLPSDKPAPRASPMPLIAPLPVDVFAVDVDADRHKGRAAVRATVLAMSPLDGQQPLLPGPVRWPRGVFWGVRAENGLTLAIRTKTFPTAQIARRDAVELLTRSNDFEIVTVQSAQTGAMSYWVLLGGRVVLVGGQSWRRENKSTARQLIQVLGRLPRA